MKGTKKTKKYPLYNIVAFVMFAAAVLQSVVYFCASSLTGIEEDICKNSVSSLQNAADERSTLLRGQMATQWSAIDGNAHNAEVILEDMLARDNTDITSFIGSASLRNEYSELVTEELLKMTGSKNISGAFVVLCDSTEAISGNISESYCGVYVKDSAPDEFYSDYSDLMLLRGERDISDTYGIPLDMNWQSEYFCTGAGDEKLDCFFEPIKQYNELGYSGNYANLGYWSPIFSLSGAGKYDTDRIVTYSVPLLCKGAVCGVIGISVSEKQLMSFLSETENGNYAFVLYDRQSVKKKGTFKTSAYVLNGTALSSSADPGSEITLTSSDKYPGLYLVRYMKFGDKSAYCALSPIETYTVNSPYYDMCWGIASFSDETSLFGSAMGFSGRMMIALLISLAISCAALIFAIRVAANPIISLAENSKKYFAVGTVPRVKSPAKEIEVISETLEKLSGERQQFLDDLKSERERYQIALQNSKSYIIEYVIEKDMLIVYHYNDPEYEDKEQSRYNHFKNLVSRGSVCAEDDIPVLLSLLDGTSDRNVQLRIRLRDDSELMRWVSTYTKVIRDADGKPVRIVASSTDINEEKLREQELNDKAKRDSVTGFYLGSYGNIIIEKSILEIGEPYVAAIIRLCGIKHTVINAGAYYTDAMLERISGIIRTLKKNNDLICRVNACDFSVYMTGRTPEEALDELSRAREKINEVFTAGDNEKRCCCRIGIACVQEQVSFGIASARALQAVIASNLPQYPDIARYIDTKTDADVKSFVGINDDDINAQWNSGFVPTDNIVSYALSIFEKTGNFTNALRMVLCKAGSVLEMNNISVYGINYDNGTAEIIQQYYSGKTEYYNEKSYILDRKEFSAISKMSDDDSFITFDKNFYDPDERRFAQISALRGNGVILIFPVTDHSRSIGGMMFVSAAESIPEENISAIRELVKIVTAYVIKSRTTLESSAKSEFLSRMSHEIRTPMNAILGMTAIALKSGQADRSTTECLNKIDMSAHYLLSLINDILDMSRIESGKMTVEYSYLNLEEFVEQLDTLIRVQAEKKAIYLKVEKELPSPYVTGDQLKLNQVLVNILGNAVKFTESGGITLRVTEEVQPGSDIAQVHFAVIDTGIGISAENQKRIFNSFEQADAETSRKYGGTGLGLSISSNLVRLLGGKLEVKSKLGSGSEFFFTLPFKLVEKKAESSEHDKNTAEVEFKNRRILLAEDDALNLEIAKTLLEYDGMSVETAENGLEAVEKFTSSPHGYYDAVLMDIRMPVMDGLKATEKIRGTEHPDASSIPIIAMTANAFNEDMRKSEECGMNGHLTKPIDMNMVRGVLRKVWSNG